MPDMLTELQAIIADRQKNPKPGSYTNSLFDAGLSRIAQKVGEEATEVVVAALSQGRDLQIGELSDLFYHTLVLMAATDITLDDVYAELERRHGARTDNALNGDARERGSDYASFERSGHYLTVAEVHTRYIKPAVYGQKITVRCWIETMGSRGLTFAYEVVDAETRDLLMTGWTKHVCITHEGRVATLPAEWRAWNENAASS